MSTKRNSAPTAAFGSIGTGGASLRFQEREHRRANATDFGNGVKTTAGQVDSPREDCDYRLRLPLLLRGGIRREDDRRRAAEAHENQASTVDPYNWWVAAEHTGDASATGRF